MTEQIKRVETRNVLDTYIMYAQTNTVGTKYFNKSKEKSDIQLFKRNVGRCQCKSAMTNWAIMSLSRGKLSLKKRADVDAAPVFQLLFQYTD